MAAVSAPIGPWDSQSPVECPGIDIGGDALVWRMFLESGACDGRVLRAMVRCFIVHRDDTWA